jgi:hypothetical protein
MDLEFAAHSSQLKNWDVASRTRVFGPEMMGFVVCGCFRFLPFRPRESPVLGFLLVRAMRYHVIWVFRLSAVVQLLKLVLFSLAFAVHNVKRIDPFVR